ncbi:MAG TPA: hypothetical protein VF974_04705 [Patescibacteria group bacterium]
MIEKFKYNKETLLVDIQLKLDEIIDFVNEIAQIESDILLDISQIAEDLRELEAFVGNKVKEIEEASLEAHREMWEYQFMLPPERASQMMESIRQDERARILKIIDEYKISGKLPDEEQRINDLLSEIQEDINI